MLLCCYTLYVISLYHSLYPSTKGDTLKKAVADTKVMSSVFSLTGNFTKPLILTVKSAVDGKLSDVNWKVFSSWCTAYYLVCIRRFFEKTSVASCPIRGPVEFYGLG